MSFLLSHIGVLSALGVAALDLVFALSPNLEANGLLHAVYLFLKGKKDGSAS